VHSVRDVFANGDPDRSYREDYILYSPGDTKGRRVKNHHGPLDEGPVLLPLAPGTYRVKARAARYGTVMVNVVIEAERTTVVHLDGTTPSSGGKSSVFQVRLPNGEIVGWQAAR
jgi:hypothetical protein